jgi:ubiquitin C-terminal hydrolase
MKIVPNILILNMKEYRVGLDMSLIKMQTNLKWIEFIDISNYSMGQKGTMYELYAYVTHVGTGQSGHYTCAVKRKHPF